MMTGRPGRRPLEFLPDEARSLPPPKLTDPRLAYFGFLGYCAGLLDNAIRHRPVLTAVLHTAAVANLSDLMDHRLVTADIQGVHRQLLYVTSFFFVGYYLLKRQDYMYALKDHDMFAYIKLHPEDFSEEDKKTYGEKFEEFYPVR